jgi:hypothetical protein
MAIAVAYFGEVHCDGDPVRRVPVSLLEPAFIGVGLLARVSAPRRHSVQLGVNRRGVPTPIGELNY